MKLTAMNRATLGKGDAQNRLRIMKITPIFLLATCLQISAVGKTQNITYTGENVPLQKVFEAIKQQTNFVFFYRNDDLSHAKTVTVSFRNVPLETALEQLFKAQPLIYSIVGNTVVVSAKPPGAETQSSSGPTPPSIRISGKVTNDNGEPLEGVSVMVKGTINGTLTQSDGKYSINVNEGATLLFSFIGYQKQEIKAGPQAVINIQLKQSEESMQNTVVIGYGTIRKNDLTGSVSSVKGDRITEYPALNAVQALQGRAAGVLIQSTNGEPGADFKVRVRGQTSINAGSDPLYVVDGFVGAPLPAPEDIASMDILKDASATSIYGSRGANGVIIITTKMSTSGKSKINLNVSGSSQSVIHKLDLLNADQFVDYVKEAIPGYVRGKGNTDWQDAIFRKGSIQNDQLSVSGGADKVSYYVSGSYFNQDGIVINSTYKRLSLQTNLNFQATDKLKMGINSLLRRISKDGIKSQEFSGGATPGVLSAALNFAPDQPIYNPDGSFSTNSIGDPSDNPYAIATQLQNNTSNDEMTANAFGEYQLLKGLKLRVNVGANTINGRNGSYTPTTLNDGRIAGGIASLNAYQSTNLLNENYLAYNARLGADHNLNIVAGYSYQKIRNENWGSQGQNFVTDAFSFWNLGSASVYLPPSSGVAETELVSAYSRINYSFRNKYLFTLSGRDDGYSAFSKNNKYAFFPSGAFAWNLKEERLFKNVKWLNQLKGRVSYGLTGNQAIDPYQTLARLSTDIAVIGGTQVTAVRPTSVANDNLTWETTTQLNTGIDIGLFDRRVSITADYYRKITSNLLFSVPLPQYTGYATQLQNIGQVENKGLEFSLTTKNLTGMFKWNSDFNISFNKNKILELPDGKDIFYGAVPGHMVGTGNMQILRVGQSVGLFYGYIYDGVYQQGETPLPGSGFEQTPGGEKYRDINGRDADSKLTNKPDGQLDEDDKTIIGDPNPKFIWGLNNDFSWKGFDLNIFFQGSEGNKLYSFTLMELGRNSGTTNSTTRALDRWTPTTTNTDVAAVNTSRPWRPSTQWVFDGSYLRLKNISLGYTLRLHAMERISIHALRMYVSAQNILTVTKYKGYDPEVNYLSGSGSSGNLNVGLDYGSYPIAKSVTFGLNLEF